MNNDTRNYYEREASAAPDSKPRNRISALEACIREMCHNALDLGYCDMRDCRDCKAFKVWQNITHNEITNPAPGGKTGQKERDDDNQTGS